jgi:hypothetical protein
MSNCPLAMAIIHAELAKVLDDDMLYEIFFNHIFRESFFDFLSQLPNSSINRKNLKLTLQGFFRSYVLSSISPNMSKLLGMLGIPKILSQDDNFGDVIINKDDIHIPIEELRSCEGYKGTTRFKCGDKSLSIVLAEVYVIHRAILPICFRTERDCVLVVRSRGDCSIFVPQKDASRDAIFHLTCAGTCERSCVMKASYQNQYRVHAISGNSPRDVSIGLLATEGSIKPNIFFE